MLSNWFKILTAMCQIDGYAHQPFKCVRCRADLVGMFFLEA